MPPAALPPHLAARIDLTRWSVPPVFQQIIAWSEIDRREAPGVFNLGIGLVLVIPAGRGAGVCATALGAVVIGELVDRGEDDAVQLVD